MLYYQGVDYKYDTEQLTIQDEEENLPAQIGGFTRKKGDERELLIKTASVLNLINAGLIV